MLLDPAHLLKTVTDHDISLCGVLPAVIVMEALRQGDLARSRRDASTPQRIQQINGRRLNIGGWTE